MMALRQAKQCLLRRARAPVFALSTLLLAAAPARAQIDPACAALDARFQRQNVIAAAYGCTLARGRLDRRGRARAVGRCWRADRARLRGSLGVGRGNRRDGCCAQREKRTSAWNPSSMPTVTWETSSSRGADV